MTAYMFILIAIFISFLMKALENLKKKGLDWSTVQWNDISLNILLGAIACKLVLLKKGINYSNSQNL